MTRFYLLGTAINGLLVVAFGAFGAHALKAHLLPELLETWQTAVQYQKGVTVEDLYNRDTNLRIGFRYLRRLMKLYNGNIELALVAYNRGEDAVDNARRAGIDPRNGYEKRVMGNYKGKGIIQQAQQRQ